jgi:MFS family permease
MSQPVPYFKKIQPFAIWGISDLYFILAIVFIILFGVLAPDLKQQLNFTSSQLGLLGFAFFLSTGLAQPLTGRLTDTWGPRFTLTLSACITASGLFLLATTDGFFQAFLAQMIIGIGFSTSYVGTIYLAAIWFSQKQFPLFSGMTLTSSHILAAFLISIMALVGAVMMNFREITVILAVIALVIAVLLFLIVRTPSDSVQTHQVHEQKSLFFNDLNKLFHIPQFWLGAIYFSATISVFLAFSSLWSVPDSLAYGHDLSTATMLSATLRFGSALGALLSGLIASRIGRCSAIARYYSSSLLLISIVFIYGPILPVSIVFLITALLGFFFGGSALGFPLVGQYIPAALKGTGFGLMIAMGYLLCALLHYLTGALLDTQVPPNVSPTIHAFTIALTPFVVTLAVGWFCTLWLRDVQKEAL